jgi:hypothetical protein
MSSNEAGRNWLVLFVSLLILSFAMQAAFAGASVKEPSSLPPRIAALTDPNTGHSPAAGPGYMQGEVIVKLKDDKAGGVTLSSASNPTAGHKAALLRLQNKYGLQEDGPVFKGAWNDR